MVLREASSKRFSRKVGITFVFSHKKIGTLLRLDLFMRQTLKTSLCEEDESQNQWDGAVCLKLGVIGLSVIRKEGESWGGVRKTG